jgi:diketogulonate reductase-like aldo/keto reductase
MELHRKRKEHRLIKNILDNDNGNVIAYLQQPDFVEWHKQEGIVNIQFSPLGNSNAFYAAQVWARPEASSIPPPMESPIVAEIAKKHEKTPAQVVYAWGLTHGRPVLSKSVIDWQIIENLEADFDLDSEDMAKISTMDCKARFNDPSGLYRYQLYEGLDGFKKMGKLLQVPEELKNAQA